MNSTLVPGKSRHTPASAISSSFVAKVGGVGTPDAVAMGRRGGARESHGSGREGIGQPGTHARQFVGGGGTFGCGRTHDRAAQSGVAGQEPDVHGRCALLDRGQVVGKGLPPELEPRLEGHQRDGLDPREQADEKLGRRRVDGGQ